MRELVLPEARSTISGERLPVQARAHPRGRVQGLSKSARAAQHARFAGWLKERAGDELLEIRAYHLDKAAHLLAELDGATPARPRGRGGRGARGGGPPRDGAGSVQRDLAQAGASRARARADARPPLARRARGAAARRHAGRLRRDGEGAQARGRAGRQEARGVRPGRARGGRTLHAGRPRPRGGALEAGARAPLRRRPCRREDRGIQRPRPDRVLGRRPRDGGGVPPPCPRRRARSRTQGPRGERDPGTRVDVHHEARPSRAPACCSSAG